MEATVFGSLSPGLSRPLRSKSTKNNILAPVNAANIGSGAPAGPMRPAERVQTAHPDALRRRQQAEARLQAAQVEAQTAQRIDWWIGTAPSNLISAVSPSALRSSIETRQLVMVDFFAPWCLACRRIFPKLLQLAENNPDVLFIKVNGGDDAMSKYVESLGVDRLPYFHLYKNGNLQTHFAANLTKVNRLRAEIAAFKESAEPSCLLER